MPTSPEAQKLLGVWRVPEGDRKALEQSVLALRNNPAQADALKKAEAALEHWQRLVLRFDQARIVGDIGDGAEAHSYSVKKSWTGPDGMPGLDLELRAGTAAPQQVSVLFTASNKVLFQAEGIRLPLQRTGG